jgi:hypothetical protein
MFIVTYTHTRKSTDVHFYYSSNAEAKGLADKAGSLAVASPGFVSQSTSMSADFLTNTVVVTWLNQAAWMAYEFANKEFLDAYRASRIAYEAVEGGTTTTVMTDAM